MSNKTIAKKCVYAKICGNCRFCPIIRRIEVEGIVKASLSYHKAKITDLKKWERLTVKGEAQAIVAYLNGELSGNTGELKEGNE